MCPAPGVLHAALIPSQGNYKKHRNEQKSSKVRNYFQISRNTESWEAQAFKTRYGSKIMNKKEVVFFLTMQDLGVSQWFCWLKLKAVQWLMRLCNSRPRCQRCKQVQKGYEKLMPVCVCSRLLHRLGQIQQFLSINSPGQGWCSTSSTPSSVPYAPTTKGWEEGGQDKDASWPRKAFCSSWAWRGL